MLRWLPCVCEEYKGSRFGIIKLSGGSRYFYTQQEVILLYPLSFQIRVVCSQAQGKLYFQSPNTPYLATHPQSKSQGRPSPIDLTITIFHCQVRSRKLAILSSQFRHLPHHIHIYIRQLPAVEAFSSNCNISARDAGHDSPSNRGPPRRIVL